MITHASQPEPLSRPVISDRLCQRLDALGAVTAVVQPDGRLMLIDPPANAAVDISDHRSVLVDFCRSLVETPAFVNAVKQWMDQLREQRGQAHRVWPGTWLVPLTVEKARKRRPRKSIQSTDQNTPLPVAILLTAELFVDGHVGTQTNGQTQDDANVRGGEQPPFIHKTQINPDDLLTHREVQRLAREIAWVCQDIVELDRHTCELHTLSQELAESYEELSLLYTLSNNVTVNQKPATFFRQACGQLQQVAKLRWMALQLVDDDPRLSELSGQLYTAGPIDIDSALLSQFGKRLMLMLPGHDHNAQQQAPRAESSVTARWRDQHFGAACPVIIEDTQTLGIPLLSRLSKNLLVVELTFENKRLGILFGGDKIDGSNITNIDAKLCSSLANSMAIFCQNIAHYEDMEAMFMGTLHALTSAIDAKDSYTLGHTERVALMSRMLAQACGLDPATVHRVYLSALVHDVGKIGVPERVLTKPGTLTAEEFDLIKMHPEIGARILCDIRQMKDLIPGVLHHHERYDGNGYPHGLARDDIPLFGRLICLADSFDAMSSNRTYRPSMSHEQVLQEITRCEGTQFDPHLAEIFVQLNFNPYMEMIALHKEKAA